MSRDEVLALVARIDPGARIAFRDDGPPMVFPSAAMTTDGAAELMRAVLGVRLSFGPDSPLWGHMLEAMRTLRTSGLPEPMHAAGSYELDDIAEDGTWKAGRPPAGWGETTLSAITYLPGATPRPPSGPADPRVIGMLEQLLARARRGEVLSAAVAMVVPYSDGVTAALAWSDVPEHHMALVGSASKLARDITKA